METKKCYRCKKTKSIDLFYRDKRKKDGHGSKCKACEAERQSMANAPHYRVIRRRYHLKKYYGLTPDGFSYMLNDQNGRCTVCDDPIEAMGAAHVDHVHGTDPPQIRGLICQRCNRGIGLLRDNPVIAISCATYLMAHQARVAA